MTTLTVDSGGRELASTRVEQVLNDPGVMIHPETIARTGFYGLYYAPPVRARRPGVVLWGGSEGALGISASEAALLASHGIPALAIAYFDEPGLPCRLQRIPLEYFVKALRLLASQQQAAPGRVWILSGSRGTEAELLVAAHWPDLVHGVVAEAPALDVKGAYSGTCPTTGTNGLAPAWTLSGKPVAPQSPIPVGRIKGPVLLLSGGDDTIGPTSTYADQIMAALPHTGATHLQLNYPNAGHVALDIPYAPSTSADGGSPAANEAAHERDWPATVQFITSH